MISKPLDGLMDAICTEENFHLAHRSARENKRQREEVLIFSEHLEENLTNLLEEVKNGTYRVGPYREFYVTVPKARLVMALEYRDRVVQWALYRQLQPFLDKRFIFDTYACREGKGTHAAANRLFSWFQEIKRKPDFDNWYYLKLDISKFFYRVDHAILMDMMREICTDPRFLRLMDTIINNPDVPFGLPEGVKANDCPPELRLYDVGMPIGNLSSQMFANLYLDPLDKYCKHDLHLHYYIRYMDDVVILSNNLEMLHRIHELIEQFLWERLKLRLNSKTAIRKVRNGIEFVGYRINTECIRLRKSTSRHIKRSFKHLEEEYAAGRKELDAIYPTIQSYYGLMEHCNSYYMRKWIAENIVFKRETPNSDDDFYLEEFFYEEIGTDA